MVEAGNPNRDGLSVRNVFHCFFSGFHRKFSLMLLCFLSVFFANALNAGETADSEADHYIRQGGTDSYPALEVAIRVFNAPDSEKSDIWLIGAVHIGERAYYQKLQQTLDKLDLVLFECASKAEFEALDDSDSVGRTKAKMNEILSLSAKVFHKRGKLSPSLPELRKDLIRTRNTFGSFFLSQMTHDSWGNPIQYTLRDSVLSLFSPGSDSGIENDDILMSMNTGSLIQKYPLATSLFESLAQAAGLQCQPREIRYDRKHFEHCDFSLQEMRKRLTSLKDSEGIQDLDQFETLFRFASNPFIQTLLKTASFFESSQVRLRQMIILTLNKKDESDNVKNPFQKIIITGRNEAILNRLRQLNRKYAEKVGVFYGAAHLPEIDSALRKQGYTLQKTLWYKAMEAPSL